MEVSDQEILGLWKHLNEQNVRYIVVGGFAVNLHGFNRFTADLDIWIDDSIENRKALRKALEQTGMGDIPELETIDFVPGWSSLNLPSGLELDLMAFLKGFPKESFTECFSNAVIVDVHGVKVRFLNIEDMLKAKKATGRPQDLVDIEELKRLK